MRMSPFNLKTLNHIDHAHNDQRFVSVTAALLITINIPPSTSHNRLLTTKKQKIRHYTRITHLRIIKDFVHQIRMTEEYVRFILKDFIRIIRLRFEM